MNNNPCPQDILNQATVLLPAFERLTAACHSGKITGLLSSRSYNRFVLTGMGSSYWALYPLYLRLINAGQPAWLVETSELLYHSPNLLDGDQTLVIAASQSGASAEIVKLLDICRQHCNLVGLTNEADSPLGTGSSAALVFGVGPEATVSCKTYTACLGAQSLLGDLLLQRPPDLGGLQQAAEVVSAYLAGWQSHVKQLQSELKGIRQIYLAGRGVSLASAGTGGLIIKESTHLPAEGMSSAAFRHGPFEMIAPETFVVIFAGSENTLALNMGLYKDITGLGGKAALVQPGSGQGAWQMGVVPAHFLPLVEILLIQMMTLALGALHNHQPGLFSYSSKITTRE